uniref:Small ribosomal subunit protein uS15 N-terminal domain-containing protein n=1 Tax=Phocoena sinus TaxID=42100 RepID=A0A8C9B3U1_PHOSS
MGRMHAPGKGLSQSALPYRRSVPTWLKLTSDDVKEQIYKLAKKGLTPSQIGCRVPYRINPKRNMPRHILIKLSKIKYKQKILKAAREKQ